MHAQVEKDRRSHYPAPVTEAQLPSLEVRDAVPEFEESVDFRDYLEVILRRKWLVLTFLMIVFVTTLIVSLAMKPVFKAGGRVELSLKAPKVTKFEDVVASQMQTREFIQTQVKLLQSVSLARRVIDKLQLEEHLLDEPVESQNGSEPGLLKRWKKAVKGWLSPGDGEEMPEAELERLQRARSTEGQFAEMLSIEPQRDTTIVNIAFSFTDPALSRDVVNTLMQEFISWRMDSKIDSAGSAKEQLEKQIDVARIQLEKSEDEFNKFAQKVGIVSLDPTLNLTYRQLEEMNKALSEAQANRIDKESLYMQAAEGDIGSLPQVVNSELIHKLRETYIGLLAEYEQLSVVFKDDYPKMKNLSAKMTDLQARISAEEQRIVGSINKDYFAAVKKEEALRKDADAKKILALELNDRATQYKILAREVETNKQIYQSLLERSKEIDANVGTDISNVQIVDYATLPLVPDKPKVKLNLLLAIVVGLMGGVGIAFFLEYLDNTIKKLDEISNRFRIPLLGVLPLAEEQESAQMDYLVRVKPKSSFSEAIRTTKVSIQLSSSQDQPARSILITSTNAGEGKSTISCNLAQAFSSSEEKVLIMDCDLRKPRLHKSFTMNGRRRGLSHYLSGMCKFDEVINLTDVPNLHFIGAGPIPPNPAELLASTRMKKLLEELGHRYDRIIIDGPPAAGFADVLVLGNCVDGVILVSTLGRTHREALRIFRKSLHNVRGNLLGSIVNRLNISHHYGGYYYKYYKYYHYSYKPYGDNVESLPSELDQEKLAESK